MSLAEHLLFRDIQDLNKMAHLYQCDCNRNSKLELVQSIHYKMLNRAFFSEYIQNQEEAFIAFSTYVIFQPTRFFSVEDLMAKGHYILSLFPADVHPRKWISQLVLSGWLFPKSAKNNIQMEIPKELAGFLRRELVHYWLKKIPNVMSTMSPQWMKRKEENAIVADARLFLHKLQAEPFPMTALGVIHKKALHAVLSVFSVQETAVHEDKWRFGYGRRFPNYPNRFALIYDYCYMKDWIQEDTDYVYLTKKGETEPQEFSDQVVLEEMRKYWVKLYRKPIVALPFVSTLILELTKENWILDRDLFDIMKRWLKSYYYDDERTIFEQRVIQMMLHVGYIEIVVHPEKQENYIKSCV